MVVTIYSNDSTIDWSATDNDRIIQNAKNIIRTRKFEVPYMIPLGINPDFIDATVNEIRAGLEEDIIETLKIYEDRVTVLSVNVISVDESGNYVIAVELEV